MMSLRRKSVIIFERQVPPMTAVPWSFGSGVGESPEILWGRPPDPYGAV